MHQSQITDSVSKELTTLEISLLNSIINIQKPAVLAHGKDFAHTVVNREIYSEPTLIGG